MVFLAFRNLPSVFLLEIISFESTVHVGTTPCNLGLHPKAKLENTAWQVAATYVLTGEKPSYGEGVLPLDSFDPAQGHWGALELAARYSEFRVDRAAFPFLAHPQSARGAKAWAVGLNWYLNRSVKVVLNYEQTNFLGEGRQNKPIPEKIFLQRFQLRF